MPQMNQVRRHSTGNTGAAAAAAAAAGGGSAPGDPGQQDMRKRGSADFSNVDKGGPGPGAVGHSNRGAFNNAAHPSSQTHLQGHGHGPHAKAFVHTLSESQLSNKVRHHPQYQQDPYDDGGGRGVRPGGRGGARGRGEANGNDPGFLATPRGARGRRGSCSQLNMTGLGGGGGGGGGGSFYLNNSEDSDENLARDWQNNYKRGGGGVGRGVKAGDQCEYQLINMSLV